MNIFFRFWDKLQDACYSIKSLTDRSPFGPETQTYWVRRREIFSKFNKGIKTDAVGLFSATPEKIADEIASQISSATIVDAFCGIGATAVAFAKAGKKVFAVDVDQSRLEMARHNAGIYAVLDNISFINNDIFAELANLKAEAIFLDPPWGGVDYLKLESFGLKDFQPDGLKLLQESFKYFPKVILRVPRQFNFVELEQFGKKYTLQENRIRSEVYSRTVYFE